MILADHNGKSVILAPVSLNFKEGTDETIIFLAKLRQEVLKGRVKNILIDLTSLEEISPAAAVVLLAELTRCIYYAGKIKKISGNYPKTDRAAQVLVDIGFFRAFGAKTPKFTLANHGRVYIKTVFGNRSDGRYTSGLLKQFEEVCGLHPLASKRLYGALIECMDNVKGHAYPEFPGTRPDLSGEWWLCGFADPVRRQIAIVFYDLGEGIPTTIKRKRSIRIRSYLNFTDSRILKRAVEVGLSSKDSHRRGTGLPSLRQFVDFAPNGFLRVMSGRGDIKYTRTSKKITSRDLKTPLQGSLIVWTIQESQLENGSTDVSDLDVNADPVQLRLPYD